MFYLCADGTGQLEDVQPDVQDGLQDEGKQGTQLYLFTEMLALEMNSWKGQDILCTCSPCVFSDICLNKVKHERMVAVEVCLRLPC